MYGRCVDCGALYGTKNGRDFYPECIHVKNSNNMFKEKRKMDKINEKCEEATYQNPIMKYFGYEHLPPHLQVISKPFGQLANELHLLLPDNAEKSVALRKLLESKDAAVRAKLG